MPTLHNGEELGEYRIVEFLGAGGMGEVYRAVHTRIGREAAIKVLGADVTGEQIARFENEARIQAKLEHDNVASLYDYVEAGGRRCLVMEFVPGESLSQQLRRRARLEPAEALGIFGEIASAAAYMHGQGIVHRDLKPSNVRITPDGRVKVLDFGIARSETTPALTAAGQVVGTPEYASPEQLRTGRATPRSDVWALGVLLHEMVTGRVPFPGRFPNQVWAAIQRGPRPSVAATVHDAAMAARIDRILDGCLAVSPVRRHPTADAVVHAVRGDARTTPAKSRSRRRWDPATALTRARDLAARQPVWTAVALVIVAALLITFVFVNSERSPAGTARHRIAVSEGTADVTINGTRVGRTPYDHVAGRGEVVSLELRRAGYEPIVERFDISTRPVWTFTMRPAPAPGGRR